MRELINAHIKEASLRRTASVWGEASRGPSWPFLD